MQAFSDLKVLIIDDAPIVIVTLKTMLLKLGFNDRNVTYTTNPKKAIAIAKQELFDIIVCDYNFGNKLNGKQIFEELKYHQLLKDESVFILITGDNSSVVVHSIIELKPDDYLLKPFNILRLRERISYTVNRKRALHQLYTAERTQDIHDGLRLCDELLPFYPQYYFVIQKFKAEFLSKLKYFEQSKIVYQNILSRKMYDWAKVGLANSLANLGNMQDADRIISSMLKQSSRNVTARVAAASISLMNKDVPDAIRHLDLASNLVPGNSERELVIVNLCLSVGDNINALERYRAYLLFNKDTFRNNIYSKINLIRILLYACHNTGIKAKGIWLKEVKSLLSQIVDSSESAQLHDEIELIIAHIALEEGYYSITTAKLNEVHKRGNLSHFYGLYHFSWLLNLMNFDSEFSKMVYKCSTSIWSKDSEQIYASQVNMVERLHETNIDKLSWLEQHYKYIHANSIDLGSLLDIYIEINQRCPFLRTVSIKIVKILAKKWPNNMEHEQVLELIDKCDKVIRQLMDEKELQQQNYNAIYEKLTNTIQIEETVIPTH